MPVSYSIRGDVVHLQMEGEYQPGEIKTHVAHALADPELSDCPQFLFDVSHSTSLGTRSPVDLQDMAGFLANSIRPFGSRLGMVAHGELHFGLLRMAEVYSEQSGLEARVFRSIDEATGWLEKA